METFKEVSLGFAEFISQLLQETFNSVLSSQNYQLERFLEIENSLKMSADLFAKEFVSDQEIEVKTVEVFGQLLPAQTKVAQEVIDSIAQKIESSSNIVYNGRVTN